MRTSGLSDQGRPTVSLGDTLLATGPFLLISVFYISAMLLSPAQASLPDWIAPALGLVIVAVLYCALLLGWLRSFPRWVFPYWGFALVLTYYFFSFTGTISGNPFNGDWKVWLPVLSVAVIGLLWKRNFEAIRQLVNSIRADWTLITFIMYGALPLLYVGIYDEVHDDELALIGLMLVLAAGAILYMRSTTAWRRIATLMAGYFISWTIATIHLGIYWHGRQEIWMRSPGTWGETFSGMTKFGGVLAVVLLLPYLVQELFRSGSASKAA